MFLRLTFAHDMWSQVRHPLHSIMGRPAKGFPQKHVTELKLSPSSPPPPASRAHFERENMKSFSSADLELWASDNFSPSAGQPEAMFSHSPFVKAAISPFAPPSESELKVEFSIDSLFCPSGARFSLIDSCDKLRVYFWR
jgi:hypothetical protein